MDIKLVQSHVKIIIPEAKEFDINVHLEQIKQEINSIGIEDIVSIAVDYPTESETEGNPIDRTLTTPYNYYPTLKALALPSSLVMAESIYYGSTRLSPCTTEQYMSGNMGSNTYFYANGVLYFSTGLTNASVVKIQGVWGYSTYVNMPDRALPYVTNKVIAGLYTTQYKNADSAEYYMRLAQSFYYKLFNSQVMPKPAPTRLLRK